VTKQFWKQHNILVAQDKLVNLQKEKPLFEYPCVIKALDQGSSVGVIIAKDSVSFDQGIEQLKIYGTIMIEEFLEGSECTVPILDNIY
jgi:D-alanine-D-alanine ligase-like ATP-grasp enzyme